MPNKMELLSPSALEEIHFAALRSMRSNVAGDASAAVTKAPNTSEAKDATPSDKQETSGNKRNKEERNLEYDEKETGIGTTGSELKGVVVQTRGAMRLLQKMRDDNELYQSVRNALPAVSAATFDNIYSVSGGLGVSGGVDVAGGVGLPNGVGHLDQLRSKQNGERECQQTSYTRGAVYACTRPVVKNGDDDAADYVDRYRAGSDQNAGSEEERRGGRHQRRNASHPDMQGINRRSLRLPFDGDDGGGGGGDGGGGGGGGVGLSYTDTMPYSPQSAPLFSREKQAVNSSLFFPTQLLAAPPAPERGRASLKQKKSEAMVTARTLSTGGLDELKSNYRRKMRKARIDRGRRNSYNRDKSRNVETVIGPESLLEWRASEGGEKWTQRIYSYITNGQRVSSRLQMFKHFSQLLRLADSSDLGLESKLLCHNLSSSPNVLAPHQKHIPSCHNFSGPGSMSAGTAASTPASARLGDYLPQSVPVDQSHRMALPAPAEGRLKLISGAWTIAKPGKGNGGEDAFFHSSEDFAGVADGVGEWGEYDCCPRQFALELMHGSEGFSHKLPFHTASACRCGCGQKLHLPEKEKEKEREKEREREKEIGSEDERASLRALRVLKAGFEKVLENKRCYGSSTSLVAGLDSKGENLGVASLGDSTCMVLRRSCRTFQPMTIAKRTKEQQHFFNCPYQLSLFPKFDDFPYLSSIGMHKLVNALSAMKNDLCSDQPEQATLTDLKIREGDLIILGTDGLFDNLFDQEIISLASLALSPYESKLFLAADAVRAGASTTSSETKIEPKIGRSTACALERAQSEFAASPSSSFASDSDDFGPSDDRLSRQHRREDAESAANATPPDAAPPEAAGTFSHEHLPIDRMNREAQGPGKANFRPISTKANSWCRESPRVPSCSRGGNCKADVARLRWSQERRLTAAWLNGELPHPLALEPPKWSGDLGIATPPGAIARGIAEAAFYRSIDSRARTPFGKAARAHGASASGGKPDDITVVVCWVCAEAD